MNVRLLSLAEFELGEAIAFYERRSPGLGRRFFKEFSAAIDRIRFMPEAWPLVGEITRKIIMKGYPYSIFYQLEQSVDELVVTAVAHHRRNPTGFEDRIH